MGEIQMKAARTFSGLMGLALAVALVSACSAFARHHNEFTSSKQPVSEVRDDSDQISGEWNVSFFVRGHGTTPALFILKLDGEKVTGAAYSDHTGAGTIREGKWADGKLSFVLDFKKHESIAVKGGLQNGKLAGEFTTEGFTGKWEAVKK